ncbi:verticillium wilt disease resistance protein [Medicago truncatula]|uniref:Verticillium wilt disease resistance protein n=1 Tax=Medicago truncatula TaxID=3880 RepID=G7JR84_MEDTR|nr:verticillium wilt disease resistance protein [Medicago truncatula]
MTQSFVKSLTSVRSWSDNLFISGGNPHLISRFCGVALGSTTISNMVSKPLHDSLGHLLSSFVIGSSVIYVHIDYITYILFLPYLFQTSLAFAKCLEDQQSFLIQFKNNLTFHPENSTKLILWNKSIACCKCNWSGVTCDNEGYVIGLDLSEESISGGFNESSILFNLLHLKELNLAHNYLNSSIRLSISQLTRLVTLDLSSYVDTKPKIPNLQKFIQNLTNIRQMYLDGISITSRGHEWSNALLPLRDLQKLSMSDCDLSGPLDSSLTRLENLTVIVLGENNFSSPVPQTFANFKNLTTLNLRKCGLIGTFPQNIFQIKSHESLHSIILRNTIFFGTRPHTIGNMTNLFLLDLSHCQLYGTFPNSLSNLTHLTDLRLSHNDLYGSIPSYLFTLPSLERISLASNQFSKFDEFINVSSNVMEFLDLSSNNLSGPFPTSLFQFRSLFFLDLSSNRLNGSMQLDELLELRNLTDLTLSYNNISIIENDASVDQTAFPKLQTLYLASCNLQTFPRFLKNQSTLGYLNLSANQIQGVVPNWIWKLKSLSLLDISYNFLTELEGSLQNITSNLILIDLHNNQLQGSVSVFPESIECLDYSTNNFSGIPHDIGNYLSSTNFLSLSNNSLQGSIPHSLCKASNLLVLDLSFNNILGTISPCLITMTSILEALNLRNNNLNGSIPDTFPTSCVVNFHANLLHGPIPKSLSHCSSLKVLDIGSNQIVGGFPCFLKHIPTLSVLVLRNNRLHGSIECSHSLENKPWKMIQIVDIALNNFNGKIPEKYFMTWERMMHDENDSISDFIYSMGKNFYSYYQDSVTVSNKAIDFSSNHFEGPIPELLMKFKAIHVLNFSNNVFSGEIPSTIENLKQLESLDLSNNSLIPTGTQLQSFEASSFEGNDGLYGPSLNVTLYGKGPDKLHSEPTCEKLDCSIDWNFLSVELGFVFGLGIIITPLLFWKKWRVSYWKLVDKILCWIFRRMYFEYATDRGQTYRILRW